MSASKAASSHPEAETAAELLLQEGGNSIDAILGGFLAAAALDPATLFAPLAVLVAGVGRGARCIDGRALPPGAEARRPRGFAPGQATPEAAVAAIPRSLAALALAHTYGASKAMSALVRPAAAAAKKLSADGRAGLLATFAARGPRVLQQSDISRALLLAAGPGAGGMFVEADLHDLTPTDERGHMTEVNDGTTVVLPAWQSGVVEETRPGDDARRERLRPAEVLVAADVNGAVAAIAWSPDPSGVLVPELDVRLPRDAAPVLRGVPRVAPRSPRAAALPLAVLSRPSDGWYAAVGVSARPVLVAGELHLGEAGLVGLLEAVANVQRGTLALAATSARGSKVHVARVAGRR